MKKTTIKEITREEIIKLVIEPLMEHLITLQRLEYHGYLSKKGLKYKEIIEQLLKKEKTVEEIKKRNE